MLYKTLALCATTAALALMSPCSADAAIVRYELVLTIATAEYQEPCSPDAPGDDRFGCISVGDTFRGGFGIDSSFLSSDGVVQNAPIVDFRLPFGNALYSTGPDNLTLGGFRNPQLSALAPGFVIQDSEVVDLLGGVYGIGDRPFIDMYGYAFVQRNAFRAYDGNVIASGSLDVRRVPEPATLSLVGVAMLFVLRRRRTPARVA